MKRALSSLFALASLLLATSAIAENTTGKGHWQTDEIKWSITNQGGLGGTAIWTRDTTFNVVAAGQTDTSGMFTLDYASIWHEADFATQVDTLIAGYLLIQSDSLGVAASTLSSVTYEIDGKAGGFYGASRVAGWVQIDSTVARPITNPATGCVILPLRLVSGAGTPDPENSVNWFYKLMACEALRVRITAATGLLSASRIFVRYWVGY